MDDRGAHVNNDTINNTHGRRKHATLSCRCKLREKIHVSLVNRHTHVGSLIARPEVSCHTAVCAVIRTDIYSAVLLWGSTIICCENTRVGTLYVCSYAYMLRADVRDLFVTNCCHTLLCKSTTNCRESMLQSYKLP